MQNKKNNTAKTFEKKYSSLKNFKKYGIFVGMLVAIILFATMFGILYQTKNQFNQNLVEQSKNLAHDLNLLRKWTIKHRGIYVNKSLARLNLPIKGVSEEISSPSITTDQNEAYILKRFSHITKGC